ncbi:MULTISPECIES: AAA family ATPase [Burkholderia]|uniref:AAA family ATPase n=1 Tax=Burkholderia TaxID=32008 RepID=UPI00087633B4|nr:MULTISPECIES: AAA family ATPase [Burkholderia]TCT29153.1 AAA domain-containing protein [Burkholderia vietnamiensis]SCZ31986.1 UvrD/REP helicase N-terminal domain-containing protein [Burkholderia vietnamiensis]SFX86172.1 UvrD/REP helicase N-terminal domain-containing protein [Burkholderia vietnamiensis]
MSEIFWVSESNLDPDQTQAVQGIGVDESFLLRGPAGSGKTNILLLRAKWFTLKAKSHLQLVVFTKSLKVFLQSGCAQYKLSPDIVVTGVQFFRSLLDENGIEYELTKDFEVDRAMLAGKAKALIEAKDIKQIYDALLVDEAQDYTDTELYVFRRLANRLVLAADSRQSIYKSTHSPGYLENLVGDKVVTLEYHYRSGLKICNVADAILRDPVNYPPVSDQCLYDETARPSLIDSHACGSFDAQISEILLRLPDQLKLYPQQRIGVLFPKNEQKQAFLTALESSAIGPEQRIWVDTLHGSKGWEFVATHIGGCEALPKMGPAQKRLIYTGILRARTSVSLYYSGNLPGYLSSAVAKMAPPPDDPEFGKLFEV